MGKHGTSKYAPLAAYLRAQRRDRVRMSFAEIERVIGAKLPPSAATHRAWWSNNPLNNVMTKAWLDGGFESEQVDLGGRKLVFRRVSDVEHSAGAETLGGSSAKLALFGWMSGTVVSTADLTEPADPDWGANIDDERSPAA
jgi:hypothetical protein